MRPSRVRLSLGVQHTSRAVRARVGQGPGASYLRDFTYRQRYAS